MHRRLHARLDHPQQHAQALGVVAMALRVRHQLVHCQFASFSTRTISSRAWRSPAHLGMDLREGGGSRPK
jgi:hypothetical protein